MFLAAQIVDLMQDDVLLTIGILVQADRIFDDEDSRAYLADFLHRVSRLSTGDASTGALTHAFRFLNKLTSNKNFIQILTGLSILLECSKLRLIRPRRSFRMLLLCRDWELWKLRTGSRSKVH